VETLVRRCERALEQPGVERLALGGGVAANGPLRARVRELGVAVDVPPIQLCTDNAAMIASAARFLPALPFPDYLALDAYATGERDL
jgi:N6-L-threonylcarbamoyladenine synthase